MLYKLRVPLLVSLTLLGLVAVGCSSDDEGSGGDSGGEAAATVEATESPGGDASGDGATGGVAVELNDSWQVIPVPDNIAAGEVAFTASNAGAQPHELVVVETDLDPTDLPVEAGAVPASGDGFETLGKTELLDGGASGELTLELEAGNYLLICNVAGHYQLGMTTAFTVN